MCFLSKKMLELEKSYSGVKLYFIEVTEATCHLCFKWVEERRKKR
jgi:hypothetical protein